MLESKRRAIIFLSLSFLLAAIAGFMFLQKVESLNTELGEMSEVYVAASDISARALITPDQVKTIEMPNRYISSSYITDAEDLMKKITVVPLSQGDVITDNILKNLPQRRDANTRLVAMYSSKKVRFDQMLRPNDRVDIVVNHSFGEKPKTMVFMRDVKVAMVKTGDKSGETTLIGVSLEVPFEKVDQLIHMETYADSIRVLKANAGRPADISGEPEPTQKDQKSEQENQQQKDDTETKKEQQQKDDQAEKKQSKKEQEKKLTKDQKK